MKTRKKLSVKAAMSLLDKREKDEREEVNRRHRKTVRLTIEVDAFAYGELHAAALLNDCTVEQAASAFVCGGSRLHEWWDHGCPEDDYVVVPQKGVKP